MMEYKGYIGKVEFDADGGILHGEVIGIRDVVTFQGQSVEEVEKAFRESVDDYLAFCAQRGENPDKPCSGKFVLRIDQNLHRQMNALAGAEGASLNGWVAQRLQEAVETRTRWRRSATGDARSAAPRRRSPRRPR